MELAVQSLTGRLAPCGPFVVRGGGGGGVVVVAVGAVGAVAVVAVDDTAGGIAGAVAVEVVVVLAVVVAAILVVLVAVDVAGIVGVVVEIILAKPSEANERVIVQSGRHQSCMHRPTDLLLRFVSLQNRILYRLLGSVGQRLDALLTVRELTQLPIVGIHAVHH